MSNSNINKLFALFILVVFIQSTGFTQWKVSTPTPNDTCGVYDLSIGSKNSNVIWAAGAYWLVDESEYLPLTAEKIPLFNSNDGGQHWNTSYLTFGYKPQVTSIAAVDENKIWVSGVDFNTNNFIMQTEDGGNSWGRIFADGFRFPTSYINGIYFWDKNNGIAMGDPTWTGVDTFRYYEVQLTSNGGKTWERISRTWLPKPGPNEYGLPAAYCVRGDDVWFGTYDYKIKQEYRIFHSKDRGKHWTAAVTGASQMSFADANNGIAFSKDKILITQNGGDNWTQIVKPFPGNISCVTYTPDSLWLIVTTRIQNISGPFRTYISKDQGATWQLYDEGNNVGIVRFSDDGKGYGGEWQPAEHATRMFTFTQETSANKALSNHSSQVLIYPNPSSGIIHWVYRGEDKILHVQIRDSRGNILRNHSGDFTNNNQLNLSSWPAGAYILHLTTLKNNILTRFVIQ